MKFKKNLMDSPIGKLSVYGDATGLSEIRFDRHRSTTELTPIMREALRQLHEYFAGERRGFDLPLSLQGTDFQVRVWDSLRALGFGETTNYGTIAHSIGSPRAYRAVGNAVGQNPLPIIIPCHRIIHADGGLGGFSGGLGKKRWLLHHEAPHFWTPSRNSTFRSGAVSAVSAGT